MTIEQGVSHRLPIIEEADRLSRSLNHKVAESFLVVMINSKIREWARYKYLWGFLLQEEALRPVIFPGELPEPIQLKFQEVDGACLKSSKTVDPAFQRHENKDPAFHKYGPKLVDVTLPPISFHPRVLTGTNFSGFIDLADNSGGIVDGKIVTFDGKKFTAYCGGTLTSGINIITATGERKKEGLVYEPSFAKKYHISGPFSVFDNFVESCPARQRLEILKEIARALALGAGIDIREF